MAESELKALVPAAGAGPCAAGEWPVADVAVPLTEGKCGTLCP